jgi:hypothetical protein
MSKPQKFDTYKEFAADYVAPKEPALLRLKPGAVPGYCRARGTGREGVSGRGRGAL